MLHIFEKYSTDFDPTPHQVAGAEPGQVPFCYWPGMENVAGVVPAAMPVQC